MATLESLAFPRKLGEDVQSLVDGFEVQLEDSDLEEEDGTRSGHS